MDEDTGGERPRRSAARATAPTAPEARASAAGVVPAAAPPARHDPIPTPLRVASEVSGRLLVVAAALGLLIYLVILLRIVVIPVAIAVLLAALLAPVVQWLAVRRVPRGLATALVLVGGLALLGGLLSFVINTFISGFPELRRQLVASVTSAQQLLAGPPFNLPDDWLADLPARLGQTVSDNRGALTSGALSTAATVGEIVAGIALAFFALIFFLYDGPRIWRFLLRLAPRSHRDRVAVAGLRSFATLVGYVRATAIVAIVDATGIGLGLYLVGVPLAVPLAALVFLGAFIPTVGAVLTGTVAVLIALVANGPVEALIVLAIVIAVQQLEGNVLQPLLLGRAVRLHELAIVLAVAAGVVIAGITGALLAVPLLAVVNTAVRSFTAPHEHDPASVDAVDPGQALPPTAGPRRPGTLARLRHRLLGPRGE
ncbi:MAG TPA: AI-2E family transporter [Pseudonocardia sp.]|nr:AI-2E family transporter [Pseudonocardia sp.]